MSFTKLSAVFLSLVLVGGVLTGCGKNGGSGSSAMSKKPLPPLDMKRIAADEARGIRFSADKRTLVKYNRYLPDKEYTIPTGVTTIGKMAFVKCKKLTSVTIPSSVTTIGDGAFARCPKVEVSPENPNFYLDASGALIDRKNAKLLYLPPRFSGAYTIPDGVTTIGEWAFLECRNLTSVTIPAGVTTIGVKAFMDCRNLTSVTIPPSVTTIGKGAFSGCKSLTSVTIPSSVTTIGEEAFTGCPCKEAVKRQFPSYR